MTLFGGAAHAASPNLPAPTDRYFDTAPRSVLRTATGSCRRPRRPRFWRSMVSTGSSRSHYMQGIAAKAYARGMNVVLLNQRNCGNTEHLSAGLFHSGLTEDARHVIDEADPRRRPPRHRRVRLSLGGNLAVKLCVYEHGDAPPPPCSVSSRSRQSSRSATARALERRQNVLYEWNNARTQEAHAPK